MIVDLTFRTYPTPDRITTVDFHGSIGGNRPAPAIDVQAAAVEVLRAMDVALAAHGGWNGGLGIPTPANPSFSISLTTYNGNQSEGEALLGEIAAWVNAQDPSRNMTGLVTSHVAQRPPTGWSVPGAPEGQVSLPWDDPHHDSEIGTEHLVTMSKWVTRTALHAGPGETGLNAVARALINLTTLANSGWLAQLPTSVNADLMKSQGGARPNAINLFRATSQNPVLLDTVAFLTSQWRVPTFPQLPPSSQVLKTLWPRLQKYAITSQSDPLHKVCVVGAAGNATSAVACMDGWTARVPKILVELNVLKDEMFRQFPPTHDGASHWSGSYWHEAGKSNPLVHTASLCSSCCWTRVDEYFVRYGS